MVDASIEAGRRCLPLAYPLSPAARPWQRRASTQILAAVAAALPMAGISIWMHLVRTSPFTLNDLILWPLLGGGTLIFWILLLHLLVCGDRLDGLGFRLDRPWLDVCLGLALSAALLAFHFAYGATVAELFPPRPPVPGIFELLRGLARDPWLLILWLGPVVWIGVALFEELLRTFLLRRLWQVWNGPLARWIVILAISALVGVAHGYQGSAAIVSIGVQSVFKGWFYMLTGRIRALVIAHALYDSIQIVMAVVAIRQMGP